MLYWYSWLHYIFIHLFFMNDLPRIASSILMNCYQWGTCLSWKTPSKEPMKLAVNSFFHHRRPHEGLNSGPFNRKLNDVNHSGTDLSSKKERQTQKKCKTYHSNVAWVQWFLFDKWHQGKIDTWSFSSPKIKQNQWPNVMTPEKKKK